MERTSRIMNLQPPHNRQGHQPPLLILDQAAQGPIQPGLEYLQGWGIHNLSGQLVPAPHHSHSKELPPDIQPKSSHLQLNPPVYRLPLGTEIANIPMPCLMKNYYAIIATLYGGYIINRVNYVSTI